MINDNKEAAGENVGENTSVGTPMIRMSNVKKSFGDKHVLRGVNLEVKKGESLVVIGGSGTGKSVLLKNILGMLEPDEGTIEVDGHVTTHMRGRARVELMHKFGMLFQGAALFDSLPVWENVAFGLIHGEKMSKGQAREIRESDADGVSKPDTDR